MNDRQFSDAELGRIIPAFLRVGPDKTIQARGPAIERLVPTAMPGMALHMAFASVPDCGQAARDGSQVQMEAKDSAVRLAGTVLAQAGGYLLALHVQPPAIPGDSHHLRIDDFAPGDPAVPMIMLTGLQAALIGETKAMAMDLAAERQRTLAVLETVTVAAGRTAHELNNLISTVGLTCDRILQAVDTDDIEPLVEIVRKTALRGAVLTRAMMDLANRPEEPERTGHLLREQSQTRVLVVEDELHALEALTELLGNLGHEATPCASAEAALIELAESRFDVLLTDVILPGMSGTALAEAAQAGDATMRVALMSGYLPEGAALRDEWLFLRKPLDLKLLDRVLHSSAA